MAIRVKVQNDIVGEELNAKLGALGLEIVVDEEDKITEIKDDDEDTDEQEEDK